MERDHRQPQADDEKGGRGENGDRDVPSFGVKLSERSLVSHTDYHITCKTSCRSKKERRTNGKSASPCRIFWGFYPLSRGFSRRRASVSRRGASERSKRRRSM